MTGTGSVYAENMRVNANISGEHDHPTVTLTLVTPACNISMTGQFSSSNTITGNVVVQGGFQCPVSATWTLVRQ